jgi:hypothetical protein
MMSMFYIPFILQGGAMFADEFYFHHKRRLPLWEKIGHPLDTITVLICYLFLLLAPPTETNIFLYSGLALFSCLFVTKDEFVHAKECSPGEHWLHAVLFILHPIILGFAGWMWFRQIEKSFLFGQSILTGVFLIYQIIYWSRSHE